MIAALGDFGIEAQCIEGLTGVWTLGDPPPHGTAAKIGSIGLHVNKGITTHGLAINVNNDLQPFEWIVPCGIEGVRMTSVCREDGAQANMDTAFAAVGARYAEVFERTARAMTPAELASAAGLPALPGPAPVGS
jgi:lipoate-protein ligase B